MIHVDSFAPPIPLRVSFFASRELLYSFRDDHYVLLSLALDVAEKKIREEERKILERIDHRILTVTPPSCWRYCLKDHDNGMVEIEVEATAFLDAPPKEEA